MWAIRNKTPFAVDRNWLRDKNGVHHWLIAVKATFQFTSTGQVELAEEQRPPVLAPEYKGEPGKSSLRYDSDLLAAKPATEVLMHACAHAPGERPVTQVDVQLRVGSLKKMLRVFGTRVFSKRLLGGVQPSSALPFVTREIDYGWAFGGLDTSGPDPRRHLIDLRNPIGKGIAIRPSELDLKAAYSIEPASGNAAKVGPAGFGPIPPDWSPRLGRGGTYDAQWEHTRKPLLPSDYDDRFGLSAPDDQQLFPFLQGGERVELTHAMREGVVRFSLPVRRLRLWTRFGRRTESHGARLATVFIEPEEHRLSLVWQSVLRVASREVERLDETVVTEELSINRAYKGEVEKPGEQA